MIRARAAIVRRFGPPTTDWKRLHGTAILTGVGFFDIIHGQTGLAPNGIELHRSSASEVVSGARLARHACHA
jgi:hypothetical protein